MGVEEEKGEVARTPRCSREVLIHPAVRLHYPELLVIGREMEYPPPPRRSKGMLYVVLATCDCGSLRAMRFRKNGRMRPRLAMARVRRPVHVQNADGYAALHSCKVYVVT